METQESGVVSNHEGVSAEGTVPATDEARQLTAEELQRLPPELRPGADGKPPKITPKLLKQMRGHYFTVKHPLLENCGHKLDMINFPKRNCENCFYQFFNTHPQLVEVTDQFFRTHGKGPLIGMRGVKYFKAFVRYMATVIHFMKEEEERKAQEQANVPSGESNIGVNPDSATEASQSGEATASGTSVVEG